MEANLQFHHILEHYRILITILIFLNFLTIFLPSLLAFPVITDLGFQTNLNRDLNLYILLLIFLWIQQKKNKHLYIVYNSAMQNAMLIEFSLHLPIHDKLSILCA